MRILDVVHVYQLTNPRLINWHSRRHAHEQDQFELHYFVRGNARFESSTARHHVQPGTLFVTPPTDFHRVVPNTGRQPITFYALLFTLSPTNTLSKELTTDRIRRDFPVLALRKRSVFEDVRSRFGDPLPHRREAAVHLVQALLWDVLADLSHRTEEKDTYNVHIERAIAIFEQHLIDPVTIGEVATRLQISHAYLTRLFQRTFGVAPLTYYRRLRMESAASMLINTTKSIKEIAYALGFSSPYHFSRSFAQYAEVSPRAYRTRYYKNNPTGYAGRVV